MRLILVRHGEPDYEHDSLTEKGFREAELLVPRMKKIDIQEIYVSPLGRAKATAAPTLKALHREAIERDWMKEFSGEIVKPNVPDEKSIVWDWLPSDWTKEECFFDRNHWLDHEVMKNGTAKQEYDYVISHLDQFLAEHGYVRDGENYKVIKPNRDTIVMFCHFGFICVVMSHLLHISPMILWHGLSAAPSSVTTIYTEERREGIACFRVNNYGDISHLYAADEEPSFAARFCETYDSKEERHD